MSQGLKISKKQKDKLFAKKVKCPSEFNINLYKNFNRVYNKVRRSAKKLYYDKQFKKFTHDSKKTWSMIKEVIGSSRQKDQLPNFFMKNIEIISDSLEIANGFNTFFAGIGPKLASEILPSEISFETFCFKSFCDFFIELDIFTSSQCTTILRLRCQLDK